MGTALERIGDLLIQKGLLTREQFEACLRQVHESRGTGKPLLLSEAIASRGLTDRIALNQAIAALAEMKFKCSQCRTPYTISNPKIDAPYLCKRCGAPLDADPVVLPQAPAPAQVLPAAAPSPAAPPAVAAAPPVASPPAAAPPGTSSRKPSEVLEAARDPKRVMGKYTLVRELGRGGSAVVYKAWDEQLDQFVALKLIRSQDIGLSDQPEDATVQEFLREARTAVKLQHPNIVRVYELGRHGDRYFLSMEYVQGKSLAELLRSARESRSLPFYLDVKRYLGYLKEVAQALDYTHHRNPPIVHRDVKPQNILIEDGGRVCVVDFGLAKELKGADHLTRSGVAKGTPCYMAPEQATGKPIDARTDVYALGAILYECLAGKPPFTGPSEREILNKIVGEEVVRPSTVLKEKGIVAPLLPDLEEIALKALEKSKERRYRSAGDFAAEITRFLEGQSIHARPLSAAQRSWRWLVKRKAVAISTSAAILMGLIALVAVFRGKDERIVHVERVKVVNVGNKEDPARKSALELIDRLESDFRYADAVRGCEALLAKTSEDGPRGALRRRRDDLQRQADLFEELAFRIGPSLAPMSAFRLLGEPPSEVRFVSAEPATLTVEQDGKPVTISWARVDPRQLLELIKVAWPDMAPRSTLSLGVWCLRQGLTEEATALFSRPKTGAEAAESRRYQEELKSREQKLDSTEAQQVTRLVGEAEAALAKGDLIIARARYERALILTKDDPRVLSGLEKVTELGKKKETAPSTEPKAGVSGAEAKSATAQTDAWVRLQVPGTQILRDFAAAHGKISPALRKGDLPGAAAAWNDAQRVLGRRAVVFERMTGNLDLERDRSLRDDVEQWLVADKGNDDLALRQVFALRDLLVLSSALGDLDAAVDRLIQGKTEVQLPAAETGKIRKGSFERSKGKIWFNEIVTIGKDQAVVGAPFDLHGKEGKGMSFTDTATLLRIDRVKQGSTDPVRRLGEALLVSYPPAHRMDDLQDLEKDLAGKPEERRFRLKEYLVFRDNPVLFKVDLLGPEQRSNWSLPRNAGEVDEFGLTLRPIGAASAAFEGFWLEPGMKVEIKFRLLTTVLSEKEEVSLGLATQNSNYAWQWMEGANLYPKPTTADASFLDLTVTNASPTFVSFPYEPGKVTTMVLEYAVKGLTVKVSGTEVGTIPYRIPGKRLLSLIARKVPVQFTRIEVTNILEAPPEKAPATAEAPKPESVRGEGKPEPAKPAEPAAAAAPINPQTAKVDEAVRRAIAVLRASLTSAKTPFNFGGRQMSHAELAAWTLLSAGVPPEDRDLRDLIFQMTTTKLEATICVALQAMVLERVDRIKYQKRIWQCAQFLVDNQSARGTWGYGSPSIYVDDVPNAPNRVEKKRDGDGFDQINSFFAAMGLRACRNAGIALPKPVLDMTIQWNRSTQKRSVPGDAQGLPRLTGWPVGDPRGWCYTDHADHEPYGSTTAATVAAQAILASLWDDDGGKRCSWKKEKSIADGLAWLTKSYSVTYNPGPFEFAQMAKDSKNQWMFYLFALEQAMVLTGVEDLGAHSWYSDVSKVLVETQDSTGTWGGRTATTDVPAGAAPVQLPYPQSPLADHCFAILALKRAGQPLPDLSKTKKK